MCLCPESCGSGRLKHLQGALLACQLAPKHLAALHNTFTAGSRVSVSQVGLFPPVPTDLLGKLGLRIYNPCFFHPSASKNCPAKHAGTNKLILDLMAGIACC